MTKFHLTIYNYIFIFLHNCDKIELSKGKNCREFGISLLFYMVCRMRHAKDKGIRKLHCYSDSTVVVKLLKVGPQRSHRTVAAIRTIQDLKGDFLEYEIVNILCEGKHRGKLSCQEGAREQVFSSSRPSPPDGVDQLVQTDASGFCYPIGYSVSFPTLLPSMVGLFFSSVFAFFFLSQHIIPLLNGACNSKK